MKESLVSSEQIGSGSLTTPVNYWVLNSHGICLHIQEVSTCTINSPLLLLRRCYFPFEDPFVLFIIVVFFSVVREEGKFYIGCGQEFMIFSDTHSETNIIIINY